MLRERPNPHVHEHVSPRPCVSLAWMPYVQMPVSARVRIYVFVLAYAALSVCAQPGLGITIVLSAVTRSQSLDSHETPGLASLSSSIVPVAEA